MAPIVNDTARLKLGRRWDDGFINQRLLGLGVAVLVASTLLGTQAIVRLFSGI